MLLTLAILTGKTIGFLTRVFKIGGGSAAPGLFALRINPGLIEGLIQKIPRNVVITGTNGKTTTARMISHFAKESGLRVIRNSTGSNLERGITSTLISSTHLEGGITWHLSFDLGIWELDEFAFNSVSPKLKPDIVIFLNVSRDQLDRYGEVDKVVNRWCETLSKLNPQTIVLINADDPNLAKLEKYFKGKIVKFGKKDIKNIKQNGLKGSSFELSIVNSKLSINLPLPGLYHIYDAAFAIAAASHLNLPVRRLASSLKNFSPAFGRFEKLPFGYIFLIKNPAGATQVFETIAPWIKPQDKLLIALNDNLADGTDVSWIWDGEFEKLPNHQTIVSGKRAADLAVRLKYAGFQPDFLTIEPGLKKALKQARSGLHAGPKGLKGKLFILPTYTCLLELQKILAEQGIKQHYWRES